MEDLDSLIDNRVPKTCDPRCSVLTPALPSPTSPLAGMSTCSPSKAELSSYIPLPLNRSPADINVAPRVAPGNVEASLAQIGELYARHHIQPALLAAQHASQNLFLILGLEMGSPRSSTTCREGMYTRVVIPLVGLAVRLLRQSRGRM